mmetsp:Transcript_131/g.271  ORF Transcript_131/g.271 Transcript_131/m.271 type:complete len:336 (+) Transcript_131:2-1009(+)
MQHPSIGLGTLGLNESAEAAVTSAVQARCEIIDTGEHYGNLELIGKGLKTSGGSPFLIIKLSGLPVGEYGAVRDRVKKMFTQLGVERANLCLVHWPGLCSWDPADNAPLATPGDFQGKASSWEEFCDNIAPAWKNMEQLKTEGLVSEIGTSNFYAHHLAELASRCGGVQPFANEIFIDSSNQEPDFVADMQAKGIKVLAYRPVAYKPFPDPVQRLAEGYGVSPQAVVLGWLLARGIWPLVKCRGEHILENFAISTGLALKLSPADLELIAGANTGLKFSAEWFAKIWQGHNAGPSVSEEDVQMLIGMGVDEAKAREVLEKAGGNIDTAMDLAFAD